MTPNLKEACRQLRLSGLATTLDLRVQEATAHQLYHFYPAIALFLAAVAFT
jgi:hypothetical protein